MTTIEVVGGKWKPRILWALRAGRMRFGALQRATGASTRMLAKSLKELEAEGVVEREPGKIGAVVTAEYSLTAYAQTLVPVLDAMGEWGMAHRSTVA